MEISTHQKKSLTSVGVICELAKTKSQENYLYGIQSKAILDLDLDLEHSIGDDSETEKRLLAAIELDLVEKPVQFNKAKLTARQSLEHLREKIERLRTMADNVHKYEVKKYRECVLDIENTITDLHNNNQLTMGQLKFEHMNIVADLPEAVDLLREEAKFVQKRAPRQPPSMARQRKKPGQAGVQCDYKEIKVFDQFLQSTGGHTGGWNDEQHSIYLGLKAKYKNNLNRIEECFKEILPGEWLTEVYQWMTRQFP